MTNTASKQRVSKYSFRVAKILWTVCYLKRRQRSCQAKSICCTLLYFLPSVFVPFHLHEFEETTHHINVWQCDTQLVSSFIVFYSSSMMSFSIFLHPLSFIFLHPFSCRWACEDLPIHQFSTFWHSIHKLNLSCVASESFFIPSYL